MNRANAQSLALALEVAYTRVKLAIECVAMGREPDLATANVHGHTAGRNLVEALALALKAGLVTPREVEDTLKCYTMTLTVSSGRKAHTP